MAKIELTSTHWKTWSKAMTETGKATFAFDQGHKVSVPKLLSTSGA